MRFKFSEDFIDNQNYKKIDNEAGYWVSDGLILYRGGQVKENPSKKAGIFFSPFKRIASMYGEVNKYLLLKEANIFTGYNTAQAFCLENSEYLTKHYSEVKFLNNLINGVDFDNLKDSFDNLDYVSCLWASEVVAHDILFHQGYDGVRWDKVEDDFENTTEYQIWNLKMIKPLT